MEIFIVIFEFESLTILLFMITFLFFVFFVELSHHLLFFIPALISVDQIHIFKGAQQLQDEFEISINLPIIFFNLIFPSIDLILVCLLIILIFVQLSVILFSQLMLQHAEYILQHLQQLPKAMFSFRFHCSFIQLILFIFYYQHLVNLRSNNILTILESSSNINSLIINIYELLKNMNQIPKFICDQFYKQNHSHQENSIQSVFIMDLADSKASQQNQVDYKHLYEQEKKKVALLLHQLQLQKIKTRKLSSTKAKGKICPKCLNQPEDQRKPTINPTKQDLKGFSQKIGELLKKNQKSIYSKKKDNQEFSIGSLDLQSFSLKNSKKQTHTNSHFPMIQNFTIFGVSEKNIHNNSSKSISELLEGELLYSFNEPSDVDRQAGKLVFPSGVVLKKLVGQRAKDKAIQMMSFSYANLKSFILRFKIQDNVDEQQFENNQFLIHINPSKSLFCLCIGIYDYTSISDNTSPTKKNKVPISLKQLQEQQQPPQLLVQDKITHISMGENPQPPSTDSVVSGDLDNTQIYISQRVFCISSYYPFFAFYQQILRSLMNIVKMQRLMIYKHNNQNISQTDSQFQLNRMQSLFMSSMRDLNNKAVHFNRTYQLKLVNLQKITLLTDWNQAKTYFIQEWIFAILNMFNVQSFIDVFTLMMLEDRIVFICNNSHILTYAIYLFTNILTKPFVYAFQVVSIIPQEDFLGAPFPVVYGMLRKRKHVQESNIYRDYKNTYIFLSPDKVDIVYTQNKKHLLKCRPQKLRMDLTNLFKDLKKPRTKDQKVAKFQIQNADYALTSTIEERQMAVEIVEKVNEYILQQVVNKMPNQYQIKNLKNSIDLANLPPEKDEHSVLMQKIKTLVRKNVKDPFVEKLLDTQMMSNMVCK